MQSKHLVILFFLTYLVIGCFLCKDYGISWDEAIQRDHGRVSLDYINEKFDLGYEQLTEHDLRTYDHRYYGTLFQMTASIIELKMGWENDMRAQYLLRHYMTFFICWLAAIFFYKIAKARFKSWKWGLLAVGLLILSPRIFANSFYNPKDVWVMSAFIIATYTLLRFIELKTLKAALFHGMATAFAINTRVLGVIIFALTVGVFVLEFLKSPKYQVFIKSYIASFCFYILSTIVVTILIFPILWENTLENFTYIFTSMSKFKWDGQVLYLGKTTDAMDLPWHYPLVWIMITTPLVYVMLWGMATYQTLKTILGNIYNLFYTTIEERSDVIFMALCWGPILMVILLNSTLYDGWRHLYFIYPALLMLVLKAFYRLKESKIAKYALIGNMTIVAFLMCLNHPYQNVYFNALAGTNVKKNFELDYYGQTTRGVLEEVLKYEKIQAKKIAGDTWMFFANHAILTQEEQANLIIEWDKKKADFLISNFRFPWINKARLNKQAPYEEMKYSVGVYSIYSPIVGKTAVAGAFTVKK